MRVSKLEEQYCNGFTRDLHQNWPLASMAASGIPGLGAAAAPRDLPPSYGIDAMLGDMQVQIHETTEFASAYTLGQWIVQCELGRGLMFAVACSQLCGLRSQKSVRLRLVVHGSACSRD